MAEPHSHCFGVTIAIANSEQKNLLLKMPVWTPGSYLVREYSRYLINFQVTDSEGQSIAWAKGAKNEWQLESKGHASVIVTYDIFANDLTVRTNHFDSTHGYFNSAALFCVVEQWRDHPVWVKIIVPKTSWHISTSLPKHPDRDGTFIAQDFDTLVDSPFEVGEQEVYPFEVAGKNHRYVLWGKGNVDMTQLIKDTSKIIAIEADLFGGLPYDDYLFILHLSGNGFGGLEHKYGCSLNYPRFGFHNKEKYHRFLQLVAHEFFHLWNVKRIRPKALEQFDYFQENYTPSLWFSEGTTSYFDTLIPLWAGVYEPKDFFDIFSRDVSRYFMTPGRHVQPLSESSFDAWIKLYRPDAYSDNFQMSYYLKGAMVSLMLDLLIRRNHNNQRSLNHVMVLMWERFGQSETGFTPEQLQGVLEEVSGVNLDDFYQNYIHGLAELPLQEYLEPFGLTIKTTVDQALPYLGCRVMEQNNTTQIQSIHLDGPAGRAGLEAGDQLLAIDGFKVASDNLNDYLKNYRPGDEITVTVFHQDQLKNYRVTLDKPQPTRYQVKTFANLTPSQQKLREGWLKF
ncbi:MAG: M61 family metallopeptidase [Synechococcaceae cyanobacterium RL_1_2]|nr:M61 family metallopeptidase [Synechococcaceae cyanobacterium RL_1_2]